ncbi:hypothetical protein M427DRAFT_52248 [Gonapodya prolifera JEL478]|uniref:Uncharacterized protein n=1 Tax=Gonapodya prolifera (strain JEL478) TaxID=1344416 RepID=A0A139AVA5_GONPJ|nr:hypothetical protein M427DRAFT_52248 [Gonapodya prolifera JEL478]|eukprot:KXS20662.1 hypothetical protein M427DRAFT_52248 [Gonapodya prolifera JEL478]
MDRTAGVGSLWKLERCFVSCQMSVPLFLHFTLGALRRSGAPGVVQEGPAPYFDVIELMVLSPKPFKLQA